MLGVFPTKMNGKTPIAKVIVKLMRSGAMALSCPFARDTNTESSINSALTSSALPTFLDITFRFICLFP